MSKFINEEVKRMQIIAGIIKEEYQEEAISDQESMEEAKAKVKDVTGYVRKWKNNYWVLAVDYEAEGEFDKTIAEPGDMVTWKDKTGKKLTGMVSDVDNDANIDVYYEIVTDPEEFKYLQKRLKNQQQVQKSNKPKIR